MTDELKAKFQALVKDAPEPTGLPSDIVYARIKTVRRRRTTGLVAGLATAAVATIALAAGNLTGVDSAPPVTETPNGPKPTAIVPSSTPTTTPQSKPSIGGSVNTLSPDEGKTNETETPPAGKPSSPGKPTSPKTSGAVAPPGPYRLSFRFDTLTDPEPDPSRSLNVSLWLIATGSVLAPTFEEGGILESSKFQDNLIWSETWWGDGTHVQDDWYGGVFCPQPDNPDTMKKVSGSGGRPLAHTYAKAGAYKVTYAVTYCTPSGPVKFARSTTVTVTKPPASPKP